MFLLSILNANIWFLRIRICSSDRLLLLSACCFGGELADFSALPGSCVVAEPDAVAGMAWADGMPFDEVVGACPGVLYKYSPCHGTMTCYIPLTP